MVLSDYYKAQLRPLFEGKKIVVAMGPLAAATKKVADLRDLGAEDFLVLADSRGAGAVPSPPVPWIDLSTPNEGLNLSLHAYAERLGHPDNGWLPALESFDPEGTAMAITAFHAHLDHVAGRPCFGARPRPWRQYEDKLLIEAFWDRAGIARAPSKIVPVTREALTDAVAVVDRGAGTVWAADNRDGWHGGAEKIRRVVTGESFERALAFLSERADQVRVMPFLEGLPCSIHGMVFADTVIAFRPVELVVFQRPGDGAFHYAGAATYWDPSPEDRAAMRQIARVAGEQLRDEVDYRGTFTVDGVMTQDGFLPTELNPRWGAGLRILNQSVPDLPLVLIDRALRQGLTFDARAVELEALLVEAADANRGGGGWCAVDVHPDDDVTHILAHQEGRFTLAEPGEPQAGTLLLGEYADRGFLRFVPDARFMEVGRSVAPTVHQVFALADARLGTAIGELEPARDTRRRLSGAS